MMEKQSSLAQPFFFTGQPGRPAVMLLHGFSSGPSDVRELGEYLSEQGLTVSGPRLPGHGTAPDDLNTKRAADWNAAVIDEYQRLAKVSSNGVFAVGYSFGGNLALTTAAEKTILPTGLILINTPVFLPKEYLHRFIIPAIMPFKKSIRKGWVKPEQMKTYEQLGKYTVLPLRALHAMYQIIRRSRPAIAHLGVPIMVVQTRADFNVQPLSARYLFEQAVSPDKEIYWIDSAEHHYYETPQRFDVYRSIYKFINKHTTHHEPNHTPS